MADLPVRLLSEDLDAATDAVAEDFVVNANSSSIDGESVDLADSIDTVDVVDTVDAVETVDVVDAVDSLDAADVVDTADAVLPVAEHI